MSFSAVARWLMRGFSVINAAESAAVTNWPVRLLLVGVMFALLAAVFYRMKRRWDRLTSDSAGIYSPLTMSPPADFAAEFSVDGLFIGTSPAGDWMRRVMFEGLGVRSRAQLHWGNNGMYIQRTGEPSFFIPRARILDLQFGRGVAGTVRAKGSVLVVRWLLGDAALDSGFRADTAEGHRHLVDIVSRLEPEKTERSQTP